MNCSLTGGNTCLGPRPTHVVRGRTTKTKHKTKNFFCSEIRRGVRALDGARTQDLRFRVVPNQIIFLVFSTTRLIFWTRLVLVVRREGKALETNGSDAIIEPHSILFVGYIAQSTTADLSQVTT